MGVKDACQRVCSAFSKLLAPLGIGMEGVDSIQVDPDGPRIIIHTVTEELEAYLDLSPDGVELALTLRIDGVQNRQQLEDEVANLIESHDAFSGVDEYDVSASEDAVTVLLSAQLLSHLPSVEVVRSIILDAAERAGARSNNSKGGA